MASFRPFLVLNRLEMLIRIRDVVLSRWIGHISHMGCWNVPEDWDCDHHGNMLIETSVTGENNVTTMTKDTPTLNR